MTASFTADRALAALSKLNEQLEQMISGYVLLPELICKEHRAVVEHDLDCLEEVCREKITQALQIEKGFQEVLAEVGVMNKIAHQLGCCEDFTYSRLNDLDELFNSLKACFEENSFRASLWKQSCEIFQEKKQRFQNIIAKIKPDLERNKQVLAKLQENHGRSVSFWKNLVIEEFSAYDKSGQKKQRGSASEVHISI